MSSEPHTPTESTKAFPDDWSTALSRIEDLVSGGKEEEARELLTGVTDIPADHQQRILAGRAYGLVDPGSGLQILDGILEEDPSCAEAHREEADLCARVGDQERARKHYDTAVSLSPALADPALESRIESAHEAVPADASGVDASDLESDEAFQDPIASLEEYQKRQVEAIAAAEKRDKINSFIIATLMMAIICALLVLVTTAVPRPDPPAIIANAPPAEEDQVEQEKMEQKQVQKQPTATLASAMSMDVVSADAFSDVATPTFDAPSISPTLGAMGSNFGMSMSLGAEASGGAMFFGSKSSGKRFLFVLDDSASMSEKQIELRNNELERTLETLRGVNYHILLFAGGAYFVDDGWGYKNKQPTRYPTQFESPDGDYSFEDNGLFDFELVGDEEDFPAPEWLRATPSNIRRSLEAVRKAKKFIGTDWDNALRIAHLMQPPPDVIFFMSDGKDNKTDVRSIIRNSRGNGAPKVNCIGMQTNAGVDEFSEIARRTNGNYTIVDKNGEPIDGFEFKDDPSEFAGRL